MMVTRLNATPLVVQIPIGTEADFTGVIDLISMKAWKYKADGSGKFDVADIPAEHKSTADAWREQLIEKVAEGDDTLMERFFEEVLVMDEDPAVRANRLRLLLDVRDTLGRLGDFSQIPR
jgi:translation elongation factor EF-G